MHWIALATVVAAPTAYVFASFTATIVVLIAGATTFCVGHYVVFMHIHENRLTIRSAKQTLAATRRR